VAYGSPYDALVRFGNGSYYNAERPFEAALNAGVVQAEPRPVTDLAYPGKEVWERLMSDWENNPYCVAATKVEDCWSSINDTAIITTGRLIASTRLEKVFPE